MNLGGIRPATPVASAATDTARAPSASQPAHRSDYSTVLGERLRLLSAAVRARPGDPDLRRALNDAFAEARDNRAAIVDGAALVEAYHALSASRAAGPPSAAGGRLMQQHDAASGRDAYSRVVEAELRGATRRYVEQPTAANRALLNKWLHEARSSPAARVGLNALTQADRSLSARPPAPAAPRRFEQWVDLSTVPGAGAGNYVGIDRRGPGGDTTRVQVRLRANMQLAPSGDWTVRQIQAVGPQVSRNGRLIAEHSTVYELLDRAGRRITDPDRARDRARELLSNNAITAPARPNRMREPAPPPNTVERTGFNVAHASRDTNRAAQHQAMYGPIVVGTLGPNKTQQQRGSLAGSFASPFLGYFPTTRGLPGFEVHANRRAFVYTTLHPAGFYPGDPAGGRWASALQNRPESTPVLRESSLGSLNALQTSQFAQAYAIVDNLFRPLQGASVNARVLGQRNELRASLFEQSERFKVPNGTAVLEQELFRTWTSVDSQLNVGLQRASGAGRGPAGSASAHGQFEAGMWFYVTHNTLAPLRRSAEPTDWRIVDGARTGDPSAITRQFADIGRRFGITLRSESVLPQWNDRSAGVYVRVPAQGRWTAGDLADRLQQIGRAMPQYRELSFVTREQLRALNPSLRDGGQAAGAQTWLNTGLRVKVGSPGLFLPAGPDAAPGRGIGR